MKEISFIHIGDVHFGDIQKEEYHIRDRTFPASLSNVLIEDSKMKIVKSFVKAVGDPSVSAIFFSGDICSGGNFTQYEDFLKFLMERLPLRFRTDSGKSNLYIVPGNHDIDRKKVDGKSLTNKFDSIIGLLNTFNMPSIPLKNIISHVIGGSDTGYLSVLLINSCIGCGEIRYYPDQLRVKLNIIVENSDYSSEIRDAIRKVLENTPVDSDQLDTPLVTPDTLNDIDNYIDSHKSSLPVILTHYNLLPQKNSEIKLYTELINGGNIRDRLLSHNMPIIFLHGHIHDDTVEIVDSPRYPKAKIICASAPLLFPVSTEKTDNCGFNEMKVIFCGDEYNVPIGFEVIFHRPLLSFKPKSLKIRFYGPPESHSLLDDDDLKMLSQINQMQTSSSYVSDIKKTLSKDSGLDWTYKKIDRIFKKLDWLAVIKYDDETDQIPMRTVEKVFV